MTDSTPAMYTKTAREPPPMQRTPSWISIFEDRTSFEFLLWVFVPIIGLILSGLYATHYLPDGDVDLFLSKAATWIHGGPLSCHGSRVSAGMGRIPGCLTTLAVGAPMLLWETPYATLAFITILQYVSWFLVFKVFQQYYKPTTLLAFSIVFFLSPWRLEEAYIWNPAYLYLPAALHLVSSHELRTRSSFGWSLVHGLSIGIALQFHYSVVLLIGVSIALIYTRGIKINWAGLGVGTLMTIASLFPYFVEASQTDGLTPVIRGEGNFLFRGLIYVYPLIKSLLNWIAFSSAAFSEVPLGKLEWDWLEHSRLRALLSIIWRPIVYLLAVVSFVASAKAHGNLWKRTFSYLQEIRRRGGSVRSIATAHARAHWLEHYTLLFFFSVLGFTAASPLTLLHWHILIGYFAALVPLLTALDRWEVSLFRYRILAGLVALYFALHNVWVANGSTAFSWKAHPVEDYRQKFVAPSKVPN